MLYDNLIADLKSKQTLDGEDNPWFPQTQSTVELHSFLTNLEKIYEHVSLSRRKSQYWPLFLYEHDFVMIDGWCIAVQTV